MGRTRSSRPGNPMRRARPVLEGLEERLALSASASGLSVATDGSPATGSFSSNFQKFVYTTPQGTHVLLQMIGRGSLQGTTVDSSGARLLDRTIVVFGSGMGNGSSHSNKDLPILVAGGGFRHGEHKVYPTEANRRVPLTNLYTTLLQRCGVETAKFNNATGTIADFS